MAVVLLVMFAAWPLGLCASFVIRPDANNRRPKQFNLQDYRRQ